MDTIDDIKNSIEAIQKEILKKNMIEENLVFKTDELREQKRKIFEIKEKSDMIHKFQRQLCISDEDILNGDKNISLVLTERTKQICVTEHEIIKLKKKNKKIQKKNKINLKNLLKRVENKNKIIDSMTYYFETKLNQDLINNSKTKNIREKTEICYEKMDITLNSLELQKNNLKKEIDRIDFMLIQNY